MSNPTLRYTGAGFIIGVPSRDLTAEEAAEFSTLIKEQEALTGIKMYQSVNVATPSPAKQASAPSAEPEAAAKPAAAPAAKTEAAHKRKPDSTASDTAEGGN